MDCYDYGLGNSIKNNAWNLEHNEEILQEILNSSMELAMQRTVSIITAVLVVTYHVSMLNACCT